MDCTEPVPWLLFILVAFSRLVCRKAIPIGSINKRKWPRLPIALYRISVNYIFNEKSGAYKPVVYYSAPGVFSRNKPSRLLGLVKMSLTNHQTNTPENIPAGIAWMLLAIIWFVVLDTFAKYLMQTYPVVQVVWARFFFHTLLVLMMMRTKIPGGIVSKKWHLQGIRSLAMLITTTLFFIGLSRVQLATASTIMFVSPIFVTIFAIPLLGESVGLRRWISVLIGFMGTLIVVRPSSISFDIGLLYLLAAALSHAFYQIATRRVRMYDHALTSLLYTGLVGALVTTFIVPFYWESVTPLHWFLFAFLGLAGSVGHLCFIRAFSLAPASIVAPLSYTALIWATASGYIIFSDLPDRWVIFGGLLIVSSGLYIFYREKQKVRK
jgi:drug/metabolite transporter (DMT)-like permease